MRHVLAAIVAEPHTFAGKAVAVIGGSRDKCGRTIAQVEIEGRDVSRQLLADGPAWHYTRFDHDQRFVQAEREARAARHGLWADPESVPLWDWRATEKDRKAGQHEPAGR